MVNYGADGMPPGPTGCWHPNKSRKTQHAVAGLLPKRIRKRAEKSGKLGTQTVESNEINMIEKTLNQKVGGSIPPRPTSIQSKT